MFSNSELRDLPQTTRRAAEVYTRSQPAPCTICRFHLEVVAAFGSHAVPHVRGPAHADRTTHSVKNGLIYIAVTILYLLQKQSRRLSCGLVRPRLQRQSGRLSCGSGRPRCEGIMQSTELFSSFIHPHWSSSPSSDVHPDLPLAHSTDFNNTSHTPLSPPSYNWVTTCLAVPA